MSNLGQGQDQACSSELPQEQSHNADLMTVGVGRDAAVQQAHVQLPVSVGGGSRLPEAVASEQQQLQPVGQESPEPTPLPAVANYIYFNLNQEKEVYQYRVVFYPECDALNFRFKMLNKHIIPIGGINNGNGRTLHLPEELPNQVNHWNSKHPATGKLVEISVIFEKKMQLRECVHLFNVIFKRIMRALELTPCGRHHLNPKDVRLISEYDLEVWPGYDIAVNEYEGGIQLCFNTFNQVLWKQNVLEIMHKKINANPTNYKKELASMLIGSSIMTKYNNKLYRVDDIDWNRTPSSTFITCTEEEVSFVEYYKTNYNLRIKDLDQPLLVSKSKCRKYGGNQVLELIPELATLVGLTKKLKKDCLVMDSVHRYRRISPTQRKEAINKFIQNLNDNPITKNMLSDWGLSLAPNLVNLTARVLPKEGINFGHGAYFIVESESCRLFSPQSKVMKVEERIMVCGIGFYYDKSVRNTATFVSSCNKGLTMWYSQVAQQGMQRDLINGLSSCFTSAFWKFREMNKAFPECVIIYRNGGGKGEWNTTTEKNEASQFIRCFNILRPGYTPRLTYIVCRKKINTRIFASLNGSGIGNPPPGTIVDHTVTRKDGLDFFLISKNVKEGTTTPTHYIVVHDTSGLKTDHLERLTYKMCHMYHNWSGTISVPAPCQYAQKLAREVGQHVK